MIHLVISYKDEGKKAVVSVFRAKDAWIAEMKVGEEFWDLRYKPAVAEHILPFARGCGAPDWTIKFLENY